MTFQHFSLCGSLGRFRSLEGRWRDLCHLFAAVLPHCCILIPVP